MMVHNKGVEMINIEKILQQKEVWGKLTEAIQQSELQRVVHTLQNAIRLEKNLQLKGNSTSCRRRGMVE